MLSEPNTLFLILGAAVVLAALAGIACLLSNIDQGLTLFKYLYASSMVISGVTLCLFAVEVALGNLVTRSNWLTAFGAAVAALLSIFYGFFGFVQRQGPWEEQEKSSDYDHKVR